MGLGLLVLLCSFSVDAQECIGFNSVIDNGVISYCLDGSIESNVLVGNSVINDCSPYFNWVSLFNCGFGEWCDNTLTDIRGVDGEYNYTEIDHCTNGIQDYLETGVDCGDENCGPCDCVALGVEYDTTICPEVYVYDSEGTAHKGSYGYCCERTDNYNVGGANHCLTKILYSHLTTYDQNNLFDSGYTTIPFDRVSAQNACDDGWILDSSITAPVLIEPEDELNITDNFTRMGWF